MLIKYFEALRCFDSAFAFALETPAVVRLDQKAIGRASLLAFSVNLGIRVPLTPRFLHSFFCLRIGGSVFTLRCNFYYSA